MDRKRLRHNRVLRIAGKFLFFFYILFLIYFLLFSDWYGRTGDTGDYRYNLHLFREISRFIQYRETLGFFAVFTNLFGNILIFVPYGFFLPVASRVRGFFKTVFFSFGLSLLVELFQLATKVGSFDVDDIFLNTVGGALGYICFIICNRMRRKYYAGSKKR